MTGGREAEAGETEVTETAPEIRRRITVVIPTFEH